MGIAYEILCVWIEHGSEAYEKLCSQALFVDIAGFEDHQFLINSHGYATVKPDPKCVVYGVLWDLQEEEESALNEYEGVSQGYFRKDHLEVIQ